MKPSVNKDVCTGCGTCPSIAPDIFQMGEDGKAFVKEGCDCEGKESLMEQAKSSCPVGAISLS